MQKACANAVDFVQQILVNLDALLYSRVLILS